MKERLHTFEFRNLIGNIEYTVDYTKDEYGETTGIGRYVGVMFATSKNSLGVLWADELDEYFDSKDEMIHYCERTIRVNNK
ncbi:hypothetical protein AVV36_gp061 [Pectobacterium bacteriophage PM2]|uniref:Uncharacterized protein n=1 Tax=Pectobacterium bacteriophage PM2 TaxID=1429794 RepID=A0A0A0Q0I9_9CAUD|nr:hypothetical protein AVV36_gp061 [Pectobacterium bacteriophage PM2]AHY25023.1 hypothetical protein PM2_061 [Pectobacterium bacteriophage PM2]